MSTHRIHRLLRLITILQGGGASSVQDLIAKLGVSRRTLFRDLKVLELAGIPCYHEPRVGYRLGRSFFLPPINLSVPETLGLMLLGKEASARSGWPLLPDALAAINKLTATVPEPIRTACAGLMSHVSIDPGATEYDDSQTRFYTDLERCIDEGRACRFTYKSPVEEDAFTCRLEPYALHFVTRSWYVFGKTDVHKEVRVLKLSRIKDLRVLDSLFVRPKQYTVEKKLGSAWQLIPEGKTYRVELEFSPKVATNVSEVRWHASQSQQVLPNGCCRMSFVVDGLGEIAWWVCGYADQVVVLNPPELRKRVRAMFESALAGYDKPNAGKRWPRSIRKTPTKSIPKNNRGK